LEAERIAAENAARRERIAAEIEADSIRRSRIAADIETENALRRSRLQAEIAASRVAT
jgi:hypothetical protein